VVVAEGIFAAELIGPLRKRGLLADALLISQGRWVTFGRRLWRDLREGRKPPWYLVRQGWAKTHDEPAVVARQLAKGARPVTKAEARTRLSELAERAAIAGPLAAAEPDEDADEHRAAS
jgi:uridine kinase